MIVGYLDISENNVNRQEQQALLQDYARSARCRIDAFHCDSDIRNLYQTLQSGRHTVLVANIVSLGSSLRDIRNNLQFLVDNGLSLVSVKEDYTARPNQKTMDILQGFDLALNMRKSMQSIITANSLNRKKAAAWGRGYSVSPNGCAVRLIRDARARRTFRTARLPARRGGQARG